MNTKIAFFISATLTVFVMAVLFSVMGRVVINNIQPPLLATDTQASASLPQTGAAGSVPAALTPEMAAALAAAQINRQDVYSVETFDYQGQASYKVVFSSGDVVFVGMDSQVLGTGKLQAEAVNTSSVAPLIPTPTPNPVIINSPTFNTQPQRGGEHEGRD